MEPLHPNQGVGDWRLPPLRINTSAKNLKKEWKLNFDCAPWIKDHEPPLLRFRDRWFIHILQILHNLSVCLTSSKRTNNLFHTFCVHYLNQDLFSTYMSLSYVWVSIGSTFWPPVRLPLSYVAGTVPSLRLMFSSKIIFVQI